MVIANFLFLSSSYHQNKTRAFGMFHLFALCHHILYIHFKLVLSLFNRGEATLSLSLCLSCLFASLLANDEEEEEEKKLKEKRI